MATGATRYVTIAVVEGLTGRVPQQLTAWLKPYRQERTAEGWPVDRVVQVLGEHGEAVTAEQLLAAARTRAADTPPASQPSGEASATVRAFAERLARAEGIAAEHTVGVAALQERLDRLEAEIADLRQQLVQRQPPAPPRPPRRPVWAQSGN